MQDRAGLTLPINTCVSVIDLQIVAIFQVFFCADLCVCVIVCTRPLFCRLTYIFTNQVIRCKFVHFSTEV